MTYFRVRGRPWGVNNIRTAQGSFFNTFVNLKPQGFIQTAFDKLNDVTQPIVDKMADLLDDLGIPTDFLGEPKSCRAFIREVTESDHPRPHRLRAG